MAGEMPVPDWSRVGQVLQEAATLDLEAGAAPLPTLFAFIGAEPQAMVTLRPVGPGELLQAFIEVLALLLPLGVDRVAYSVAADDGAFTADVRHLLVARTDTSGRSSETFAEVMTGTLRAGVWGWDAVPNRAGGSHDGLVMAISFLLEHRHDLEAGDTSGARIAAQFGRVLLLGHELALSPGLAQRLSAVTAT